MVLRWLVTAVSAIACVVGMSGCVTTEFCEGTPPDQISALIQGLYCLGFHSETPNRPPTPAFTMTPSTVDSGGTVHFDASASTDDRGIRYYDWTMQNGGSVRTTSPTLDAQVFSLTMTTEQRQVFLLVTDSNGRTASVSMPLTIVVPATPIPGVFPEPPPPPPPANGAPTAAFTATPNPAHVEESVTFNASASTDPEADSLVYEWDVEGDGTFDGPPTATPTLTHVYGTAGTRQVGLRVTDAKGATGRAVVAVDVRAGEGSPHVDGLAGAAARGKRGQPFTARLPGASFPSDLGAGRRRGTTTTFPALVLRGRLVAPGRGLGGLRPFRRARWVARVQIAADERTRRAGMRGLALATFPGRRSGKACLRIAMGRRGRGAVLGSFTIAGGTGAAARLRGRGTFSYRMRGTTPTLTGRILTRTGSPRALPKACSSLR